MIINVGSISPPKMEAVEESVIEYPTLFQNPEVFGFKTESRVRDQPRNLDEIFEGAMNRAVSVFEGSKYSFGIESGLVEANVLTGYLNMTGCALFDGNEFYAGISSGFEYPKDIISYVLEEKGDVSEACFDLGYTEKRKIGGDGGFVHLLTNGRLNRKEYTKQAVLMAISNFEMHTQNKPL